MANIVEVLQIALGASNGSVRFTVGRDTVNHVAIEDDGNTREVPLKRLDDVLAGRCPAFIKIDVEGYEEQVLRGALATLGNPALKAISTECYDQSIAQILDDFGFYKAYYDPRNRELVSEPPDFSVSNTLLVRDRNYVQSRLREAPKVQVLGNLL